MNTNTGSLRRTAIFVGAFFLISNVTFILGALILEPILSAPDYLSLALTSRNQVTLGALLEFANGIAYLGIAVLVFPILKRRFESLALWYVGFRIIEFVMQTLADISPLSLLTLGEEFVRAGASDAASLQAAGAVLLAGRYWAFQMVSFTFGLGALSFYSMLYRTGLVPRLISVWGLLGAAVVLANTMFDIFGISVPNLGVLMLLNELTLGVWLIVRGFNPTATLSETVPQE